MCVGNIEILGIFVPGTSQKPTTSVAIEAAAAQARRAAPAAPLVLAVASRGRPVLKSAADDTIHSSDLRITSGLSRTVVIVRAVVTLPSLAVPLAARAPVDVERDCVHFIEKLVRKAAISIPAEHPVIVFDVADDRELAQVMGWPLDKPSKKKPPLPLKLAPLDVHLHLPLGITDADTDDGDEGATSVQSDSTTITLSGSISVRAVVTKQSTVGEVLQAVTHDLSRSLQARIELLSSEDIDENEDNITANDDANDTPGSRPFPARVIASPNEDTGSFLPMTDYLMHDENIDEDVTGRFVEVLSWSDDQLSQYTLQQVENLATVPPRSVEQDKIEPVNESKSKKDDSLAIQEVDQAVDVPLLVIAYGIGFAVVLAICAILLKQFL